MPVVGCRLSVDERSELLSVGLLYDMSAMLVVSHLLPPVILSGAKNHYPRESL
jgi:hypothetical protein